MGSVLARPRTKMPSRESCWFSKPGIYFEFRTFGTTARNEVLETFCGEEYAVVALESEDCRLSISWKGSALRIDDLILTGKVHIRSDPAGLAAELRKVCNAHSTVDDMSFGCTEQDPGAMQLSSSESRLHLGGLFGTGDPDEGTFVSEELHPGPVTGEPALVNEEGSYSPLFACR